MGLVTRTCSKCNKPVRGRISAGVSTGFTTSKTSGKTMCWDCDPKLKKAYDKTVEAQKGEKPKAEKPEKPEKGKGKGKKDDKE